MLWRLFLHSSGHHPWSMFQVELTIVEGRQDLPADPLMQTQLPSQPSMQDTRRSNTIAPPTPPPRRGTTSAPMAPEMPPVGFPPGAGSKVKSSEIHAKSCPMIENPNKNPWYDSMVQWDTVILCDIYDIFIISWFFWWMIFATMARMIRMMTICSGTTS